MPTVEYFLNGKWVPVEVGDGATQHDIDEIGDHHLSGGTPPAAASSTEDSPVGPYQSGYRFEDTSAKPQTFDTDKPWYERGGEYIADRAKRYGTALSEITNPYTPTKDAALDAALLGGTILAPEITGIGFGAGLTGRTLGLSKPAAEALETGVVLMGGGVQSTAEGTAAARAAAAAPGAERVAQRVENVTGDIGEAGQTAAATRGAAASTGAAGISDAARTSQAATGNLAASVSEAGRTAQAAQDVQRLGTATPKQAGYALRETVPGAESTRRAIFQDATYAKIAKFADDNGLVATADNAVGQRLGDRLTAAEDTWGDLAGSAEHKQVKELLDRLKATKPQDTGILDASGRPITRSTGAPVTWQELDDAEKALQKVRGPSSVRKAIADAKMELLEGTPAAKALESTNQQWNLTIRPAKELAKTVRQAKSPSEAFYRVAGSGKDPQRLEFAQKLLQEHHPEDWSTVVGGFYGNLLERSRGDPAKMAKLWDTVPEKIRKIVDPDGFAAERFQTMTEKVPQRGLPEPTEVPGVTLPEPTSRYLPPERSMQLPPWAERTYRYGTYLAGGYEAYDRFRKGDWWGGLGALGLTAALTRPAVTNRAGLAYEFGRGAAPGAARTGLAVAGSALPQDLGRGE